MKTNGSAVLIAVICLMLLPLPLSAALVDWVSGEVTYSHYAGEWNKVDVGMNLGAGDMLKTGIIDPVKVVRTALSNAASIAGLLLTTEALVTTFDKEDKDKQRVEGVVR